MGSALPPPATEKYCRYRAATFRLTDGELRVYLDTGDVSLVAQDLVVQVSGGKSCWTT